MVCMLREGCMEAMEVKGRWNIMWFSSTTPGYLPRENEENICPCK